MNELIKGRTLTSLEVCDMIGKSHAHLCRDIAKYVNALTQTKNGFSEFFQKTSYKDSSGKKNVMWLCSRKGCDLIAHKMTGAKGIRFTAAYIDRFYEMDAALEARENGKQVRREFTDSIKDYVALAEAQGHQGTAKYAYSNFTKLIKKPFGEREGADSGTLAMIATAEHVLGNALAQMVKAGEDAKEIYWKMKDKSCALSAALVGA